MTKRTKIDWSEIVKDFNKRNKTEYKDANTILLDLYKAHTHNADIAYLLRISPNTVGNILRLNGIGDQTPSVVGNITFARKKYNKANKTSYIDNKQFILDLYTTLKSSRKAGEAIGVSTTTFLNYLKYYELPVLPKGGKHNRSKIRTEVYRLVLEENIVDARTIANILACKRELVRVYMRELNKEKTNENTSN